jgi:hypothetical protein
MIADRLIASCGPIASSGCSPADFIINYWGPTSVVYVPRLGVDLEIEFWANTSIVYSPVLVDPSDTSGCYVQALEHLNTAYAPPLYDEAAAPGCRRKMI